MATTWKLSTPVAMKIALAEVGDIVHKDMFQVFDREEEGVVTSTIFRNLDSPEVYYVLNHWLIRGGIITCHQVEQRKVWKHV